jgi:hypothetical protein
MSAVFIAILEIWLILTILVQFPCFKWVKWLRDRDYFALLPNWSFFAPNPGTSDLQILYRDKLSDGQLTPWQAVAFREGSLLHAIWNPEKRLHKAITNVCLSLLQLASDKHKSKLLFASVPYILIVMYIKALPHDGSSNSRQFLIAQTYGYCTVSQEPKILFISQFHKLKGVSCQISLS